MKVLVTGAAGFVGSQVARALLERGDQVVGLDNLDAACEPVLQRARLGRLTPCPGFSLHRVDVGDSGALDRVFDAGPFDAVCHLAARTGVRHSSADPLAYGHANLTGFLNVLEHCRRRGTGNLVYASSSSVYGAGGEVPFSEEARVDRPVSVYAATKVANEVMAHAYHHLFGIPTTGLRFFTVYGPWGRPDMALSTFTRLMLAGRPIDVYNDGRMERDFTYIDDICEGVLAALDNPLGNEVVNLGNSRAVELGRFVSLLEDALGVTAQLNFLPMQPGDVPRTCADVSKARRLLGWEPRTPVEAGIPRFVAWYREHHGVGREGRRHRGGEPGARERRIEER